MNLTLYHSVESTCAQKVRIVLAAKGLEWEEIRLNLRKGEQFSPQYLKLNPKAVVPTLVHDGAAIRESSVINEYLEDCFPQISLRPAGPVARAQMRLLVKTIDEEVHPAIGVLSYAVFLRHQMNERMSAAELQEHFRKVADPARRERQQSTHERGLAAPAALLSVRALDRFVKQLSAALGERWSRRRPADPGWVSAGPSGHTGCPKGKEYGHEAVARERSSLDQKGRAHHLMQSSEAGFRRRREQGSETPAWLAGDEFSLADAAALPYMFRARALGLWPLWDEHSSVDPWLQRGVTEVARLPLTEIFGSESFHAMVAGYADADAPAVRQLLENR